MSNTHECPNCGNTEELRWGEVNLYCPSCDTIAYSITIHRSELIPGGNGAIIGLSDDFPDRQFLVVPQSIDGDAPVDKSTDVV